MPPTPELHDQRLARFLMRPLARASVSPNAVTAATLVLGLAAAGLFASGHPAWGGTLFAFAALGDHCDGELARLTGRTSRFGHRFDRVVSSVNTAAVFFGMGMGAPVPWGEAAGLVAGLSVAAIFALRGVGVARRGEAFMTQAGFHGFETEDVLYLIAPLGWLGWHPWVVAAGAVGAPVYLLVTLLRLRRRPA